MKFLLKMLDKVRPLFEKGGKLEKLYPLFEANDTFLFTTDEVTKKGSHIRDALDSKRLMFTVVFALLPCTLLGIYNTGLQRFLALGVDYSLLSCFLEGLKVFLPLYIVTLAAGGVWEVLFATVRKHEINEGFLVTSLLFPLICPPMLPLWQAAVGISFGVIFGKEVFGGVGMNILNPALTARAFLFFTYPAQMSGDKVWIFADKAKDKLVDGFSGATALAVAAITPEKANVVESMNEAGFSFWDLFVGFVPGSIGETSALCCLIGAAILIFTKIGSWRTMVSCVLGALFITLIMNFTSGEDSNPMLKIPFHYHLVLGGFAFGIVFMATDPVSSATTAAGKWIYGFCIGVLAIIIRCVNPAYPEGVMLAILFMNVFAPLIDHFVAQANIKRRLARGQK
ncbi:NADH:ubiquinone reductase (Na(+)-transporting) subunit B [PVC group bacterium]|nr:NADH:ubiquinone reductase (Na(+)-transporting) subunit B [PVC group bacterium]